jgi:DNA polymerase III alpha subunit (gram-positive type)
MNGYTSGEDSYYSASVNTAMSYDTLTSDITNNFSQNTTDQVSTEGRETTYADKVRAKPKNQKGTRPESTDQPKSVHPNIDASLISDLASSRAKLEELEIQVASMALAKDKERQELTLNVEQQKQEMEFQAASQKLEMERQADEQRRAFRQQFDDQRRELESKAAQQKRELEATLQAQQINKAIQDHFVTVPPNPPVQHPPPPDFYYTMVENQERQIKLLTKAPDYDDDESNVWNELRESSEDSD